MLTDDQGLKQSDNQQYPVERDVDLAMKEALRAGKSGVEEPLPFVERVRLAYENACEFFTGRLESLDDEISMKERQLTDQHHTLEVLNEMILKKWNKEKRWVSDRAEAKAAIEKYELAVASRYDFWSMLTGLLFILEGVFGYWMFKNFVLPDNGVGEHLTSAVVGLMVLAVGVFMKTIPDSTRTEASYARWKTFLGFGSAVSAVAFIVLLAYFRQVTDSFSVSSLLTEAPAAAAAAAAKASQAKSVDFAFQLSLLATLIFSSAFFGHWRRRVPKGLLQARRDDADDLLSWYGSEEYRYEQKNRELDALKASIDGLRKERELIRQKMGMYTPRKVNGMMRQAALEFIQGASSEPHTDAKKRGGDRGRLYLERIPSNAGQSSGRIA